MPSTMPMATSCCICSALPNVERTVIRVPPGASSRVTRPSEVGSDGSRSPAASAKPSSNSKDRGASTARTSHQPWARPPSGPVM